MINIDNNRQFSSLILRKKRNKKKKQKKYILIYGQHAVYAALLNPHRKLLFLWHDKPLSKKIQSIANSRQVIQKIVNTDDLESKVGKHSVHQGLVLSCTPLASNSIEKYIAVWQQQSKTTLVILDQITDERNFGAIFRSALYLGADGILCNDYHSPHENGHLAKTASGALEAIRCIRVKNIARSIVYLQKHGFWCYAFDHNSTFPLYKVIWPTHVALIFGAEGAGIRRLSYLKCDQILSIPHNLSNNAFGVDSLNLSQSIAIALYARQISSFHL